MSEDDGSERSHAPTQKRLDNARREGQILVSRDLSTFMAMAAALLTAVVLRQYVPTTAAWWADGFHVGSRDGAGASLFPALGRAGLAVVVVTMAIAIPVALSSILTQAATGGLSWVAKGYAFRTDRIDPIKGLGRMVSLQSLIGLLQAIAKVVLLGAVSYLYLKGSLSEIQGLASMSLSDAALMLGDLAIGLLGWLTLALGLVGGVDLFVQWRRHSSGLRMSFDEIRRESKEDNGSPEVKGRQRRLQAEASRRRAKEAASVSQVGEATAVIRNPGHFAVALRYEPSSMSAPVIVSMGRDATAKAILKAASRKSIPTLAAPTLARAFYFSGTLGAPIPERLYSVTALVLAYVWRLERGMAEAQPDFTPPDDLLFDANGQPMKTARRRP